MSQTLSMGAWEFQIPLRSENTDPLKIGDRVQVKTKDNSYSRNVSSYPGIIVGFLPFKSRPSVMIAYSRSDYSGSRVAFLEFNRDTTDYEVIRAPVEWNPRVSREKFLKDVDAEITRLELQVADLREKRDYFVVNMSATWEQVAAPQKED